MCPLTLMSLQMWGDAHKDLFDSGRVSFQAQDFFEPQPQALQVPGAGAVAHPAVYLVTRVLHNWPDADCVKYVLIPLVTTQALRCVMQRY